MRSGPLKLVFDGSDGVLWVVGLVGGPLLDMGGALLCFGN